VSVSLSGQRSLLNVTHLSPFLSLPCSIGSPSRCETRYGRPQACLRILLNSPGRLRSTFEFCLFNRSVTQSYGRLNAVVTIQFTVNNLQTNSRCQRIQQLFVAKFYPEFGTKNLLLSLPSSPPSPNTKQKRPMLQTRGLDRRYLFPLPEPPHRYTL
jgi:hypothetical protein